MKQRTSYDRQAVGDRLKARRKQLGWSRSYAAQEAGLAEKYYSDIERGTCGMSVETLLALSRLYGLTMDGLVYGEKAAKGLQTENGTLLLTKLDGLSAEEQECCLQMLLLFVKGMRAGRETPEGAL